MIDIWRTTYGHGVMSLCLTRLKPGFFSLKRQKMLSAKGSGAPGESVVYL